jgi:hypothetical protein
MKTSHIIILLAAGFIVSCTSGHRFVPPVEPPNDQKPIPQPHSREVNLAQDNVEKILTETIVNIFDLSRHYRKISGNPKQAMNVNAFDEVYNSSWFINRNGLKQMTLDEIARGPDTGSGPDTSGTWTIFRAKTQGVTPGFSIEDHKGDKYVIKFDPLGYPEMSTGAEIVSTKLFHAAGYNVPENYICRFHPKILKLGEEVTVKDSRGKKRMMNQQDLDKILDRIQKLPDGKIRVTASKYLSGKPIGSYRYIDVRKDDVNDVIPHQHRRELRGLRVIAAWLNHYDTKANNSLDMYIDEGYVRHYLIDFGSTLGSQGDEPMPPEIGREGIGDPDKVAKSIGSLGIYTRPWEEEPEIEYPSIGYFVSTDFEPQKYRYILPNPAFNNTTGSDLYWGAKIVMSFTDEQIRRAVEQGQYSDPEAAEYLIKTLIERRDIIGKYYFDIMPPLDNFEIRSSSDGAQILHFSDLTVDTGLESKETTQYSYGLKIDHKSILKEEPLGTQTFIQLSELYLAHQNQEKSSNPSQWEIAIQLQRNKSGNWSREVRVFLEHHNPSNEFSLLGIIREN